ncbi:hypothetical protein R7190_30935, partial [Vibrio sp. 1078-1]|nr:hypothetical protein [Vibrio sp. 1078-1]
LMQSYETQHMEEELPLHLKIWDFLLVAVGLRRELCTTQTMTRKS